MAECNECNPTQVTIPQCEERCDFEVPATCVIIDVEENDCIEKEEGQTKMTLQEFADKVSCQEVTTPCNLSVEIEKHEDGFYQAIPTNSVGSMQYVWSLPSDTLMTGTPNGNRFTITEEETGMTLLKVVATDANGCKATAYYLVKI